MSATTATPRPPYSAADMAAVAKRLYGDGPVLLRCLQHWRPHICPFECMIRHVPAGSCVLDVGCGGGLFLGLLAHDGRLSRGIGFDVADKAISLARRMATGAGLAERLDFRRLDVGESWPEGSFDVVSLIDVLHHVPPASQMACLTAAAAHVRPGGLLLYKDMARRPHWRALANRLHDLVMARQWIHYVPIGKVEAWASEAGLRTLHAESFQRLWYAHELRVFGKPV